MRENDSTAKYLLSKELEIKLRFAQRKYLRLMSFDDVHQEYRLTILEGKSQHQTVDQFCIDLYRKTRKHLSGLEVGENDLFVDFKELKMRELITKIKSLSGYDRIIVFMFCVYGATCSEVAIMLDITEGRVSQVVDELIGRINEKDS